MKQYHLIITILLLISTTAARAGKSNIETGGDVLQILIPLTGYATTFYLDDQEGRNQFYKSFLTTVLITQGLKLTINEQRPNGSGNDSFPSGHTSAAFQGAAFIQKRYGWPYGIPAYAAATFVGYSRVQSNQHHIKDVIAGAAIGTLSSYYFTTEYKGITVTPFVESRTEGLDFSMNW